MIIWWLLSGLVAGILVADFLRFLTVAWLSLSLGVILFAWKSTRRAAVFLCVFALGFAFTVLRLDMLHNPDYGQDMSLTLSSSRLVHSGDDYFAWQGKVLDPRSLAGAKVLVYSEEFHPGTYTLTGPLYPPVQYRNPGQGWHYKRKIYAGEIGNLNRPQIKKIHPSTPTILDKLRNQYRINLTTNLGSDDSSSLALALTTGDRSLLSGELKSAVYLTGVGHIMALSGLHISVLAGIIMAVFKKLGLLRWVSALICLGLIIFYVVFVGPSPSLVRAVLMSAYGVAAFLAGRERLGLPALLWTCLVMLLFNPLWLFDYAFVYSFLATFICLVAGNRLERYLYFLPEPIKRIASISLIIQLTALPLNLYLFGSFSLWSPLANIVIIPLMPVMALTSFFAGFSGPIGSILAAPASLILNGVAVFLRLLSEHPLALELGGAVLALVAGASFLVLLFLWGVRKESIIILLTLCIFAFSLYPVWVDQVCAVWFLDVGQGDSILIRSLGKWILVDCGDAYAGERAVVPALKFLGVNRLSALIITHPHADHAGGLSAVLANFPVERIYVTTCFFDSQWRDDAPLAHIVRGEVAIANGLRVMSHNIPLTNLNNNSLFTALEYKGTKLLLTGDIEQDGEKLYAGRLTPHHVVKIAHHGSSTSTSVDFLRKLQPRAAVISCGLGNRFDFPKQDTLDKLNSEGVSVYRTDTSGCIRVLVWPWEDYSIFTFTGR